MKKHFLERVISNERLACNTYLLKTSCTPESFRWFRPGQFAHIKIPNANDMILRRPISINYIDEKNMEVHFVFHIAGKGTKLLSEVKAGQVLDVIIPLGNGFSVNSEMEKIWLVGGGVGVAPLRSLFVKFPQKSYKAFLGFRSKDYVYQEAEFKKHAEVFITTDDGSYCDQGFCTDVLRQELKKEKPDVIFACGPLPFFRALAKATDDVPVFVSLEQHMGCGTGGCATCVCSIEGEYRRVCIEGPVFDMREVDAIYG